MLREAYGDKTYESLMKRPEFSVKKLRRTNIKKNIESKSENHVITQ